MYFFTADEHYNHANIIRFSNRPFRDTREMQEVLIARNNEVVNDGDTVFHLGDFFWGGFTDMALGIIYQLNGDHWFLKGSHDRWQLGCSQQHFYPYIHEEQIESQYVVLCHYAMLTWPRSHYGSWQLFGHSHGRLTTHNPDRQYDVGVDNNGFYPVSFEKLKTILKGRTL